MKCDSCESTNIETTTKEEEMYKRGIISFISGDSKQALKTQLKFYKEEARYWEDRYWYCIEHIKKIK